MTGVYSKILVERKRDRPASAVFLDRDGVVIEDHGYVSRAADVRWIRGAVDSIRALNEAGLPVILITNQAGVGRGYYGWPEFADVQAAIYQGLSECKAWVDAVWACACHEDGSGEYRIAGHSHRKPNPGMLRDAATALNLDLAESWTVGDKLCDIEAGLRAGTRAIHVETGYGAACRAEVLGISAAPDRLHCCADLGEAVAVILRKREMN